MDVAVEDETFFKRLTENEIDIFVGVAERFKERGKAKSDNKNKEDKEPGWRMEGR